MQYDPLSNSNNREKVLYFKIINFMCDNFTSNGRRGEEKTWELQLNDI